MLEWIKIEIEKQPDKYWHWLSQNPNAIHLLEQNLDNVEWNCLSGNPNAIHLLEQNLDKVNWTWHYCSVPDGSQQIFSSHYAKFYSLCVVD